MFQNVFKPDAPSICRRGAALIGASLVAWGIAGHVEAQPYPAASPSPQPSEQKLSVKEIARGLEHPWALAFLPDQRYLVTERPGRMRIVDAQGKIGPALKGLPAIAAGGQGGLLDVVLDKDFGGNRRLYFCFSEPAADGGSDNSTALASATLADGDAALKDVKILFTQQPKVASRLHFGCRIVQDGKGMLFLTLGERFSQKEQAQKLDNHLGKIVRIQPSGGAAPGNPFAGKSGALPEIWSYGHRNIQSAALGPDGRLWEVEHGPQGGDELNLVQPGRNYGWPEITFGENYGGGRFGKGTAMKGMEAPVHYWVPSIAPSGMALITSDRYGAAWKGSFVIGSLKFQRLHRVQLEGDKVVRDEVLLPDLGERVRDVREGPDGWLYLLTDSSNGRLLRVQP